MVDATPAHLAFLAIELPRFGAWGALERADSPGLASRMFLVTKPSVN
jgi:hypothetical protein